ncbi:MAG: hypothetical protein FJ225_10520 [Lentisphaerae bacterium]|nr:hypothetical protein [Lentisphaerota bacterium]
MTRLAAYYGAVFLSAFLLFQVQPMAAKGLLPLFGGSYLVWGVCMVFFQAALLLGYLYAHAAQRRLGVKRYALWHWLLLAAPVLCFPFRFDAVAAGATPSGALTPAVLRLLLAAVGLPFFALSTTSLVLQRWLAVSDLPQARNPYVLYSASNLGSMLALLTYPLIVEPLLDLRAQGYAWWGGYALLALLHAFCRPRKHSSAERGARNAEGKSGQVPEQASRSALRVPRSTFAVCFLLSAAASAVLLAVTNVLTFDIASAPFLWVLPLSVYLGAFVLGFKRQAWFPRWVAAGLGWVVPLGILLYLTSQLRLAPPVAVSVSLHLAVLFVVCMNCVAGLVRLRPALDERLTAYYVAIAAGGLAGSALVGWMIPPVSSSLVEYPLSLLLACGAMQFRLPVADRGSRGAGPGGGGSGHGAAQSASGIRHPAFLPLPALVAAASLTLLPWLCATLAGGRAEPRLVLLVSGLPLALILRAAARSRAATVLTLAAATLALTRTEDIASGVHTVARLRNFYGVYRVFDKDGLRYLQHGTTQHGRQYLAGPERDTPLAYFHPTTPAAGVLRSDAFGRRDIGMIGLGTGALAAYAGRGQTFTVFELDPDNLPLARRHFTYLNIAERRGAALSFVFGDGRVGLQSQPDGRFDLLIIDAFNSGSIPVHLLTVEALGECLRVLGADGLLLVHISNKALDLEPVVAANAAAAGVSVLFQTNAGDVHPDAEATYWAALSRDGAVIERLASELGWRRPDPRARLPRPWTDRYCNVLGALRWGR